MGPEEGMETDKEIKAKLLKEALALARSVDLFMAQKL